jgi:hypothetical protein
MTFPPDMTKTLETRVGLAELAPNQQAVVSEFTELIRKHRGQSPTDLARLAGLAFAMALGAKREDKFALTVARGWQERQKLVESEGGSLSSEEVARLLRISKTAVLKRLEAGRLLAWREARLQAARFPRWQFDEQGQVLTGLTEVLDCLAQDQGLDIWGRVLFFLQTKSILGDRRPLDLLREGKVKEVCLAAQAYAE